MVSIKLRYREEAYLADHEFITEIVNTSFQIVVVLLMYLFLIWKANRVFPVLYLFILIYFVQYIFSTHLIYFEYHELRYQMTIKADRYFDYAIPAFLSLFAGVVLFNKDVDIRESIKKIDPVQASQLGFYLLIISYAFDFVYWAGFTWLGSVVSFTGYLKYLASFCFLFSKSKTNYIFIAVVYLQLAAAVLTGGVFVLFYIWLMYLLFFISLRFSLPFWVRFTFILFLVPIIVSIQAVKQEYRNETWSGKREGGIQLLTDLVENERQEGKDESYSQSKGVLSTVGRLTQGWHLGLTLRHVPSKEPFSNGGEIISDITASILPRVFFSDKKSVNSKDKFYKYTGHKLRGNTSMSIGILGDFYINFGKTGSFIALFIFGAIIARLLYYFMTKYVLPDPLNIIWIPLILTYLIRGNNDFYIFFNGMIKGFVLFLVVNYIRHRFWNHKAESGVLPKSIHS